MNYDFRLIITTFEQMILSEHIVINADKRFGKPTLKGTRIGVAEVLNWLANGMSKEEIVNDFPELTEDSINACLFYAASREDHLLFAS